MGQMSDVCYAMNVYIGKKSHKKLHSPANCTNGSGMWKDPFLAKKAHERVMKSGDSLGNQCPS